MAACTNAVTDPDLQTPAPGYAASSSMTGEALEQTEGSATFPPADTSQQADATTESGTGTAELPQQVAALPTSNPAAGAARGNTTADDTTSLPAQSDGASESAAGAPPSTTVGKQDRVGSVDPATAGDGSIVTAAAPIVEPAKPKGVFAAFFGGGNKAPASTSRDRDGNLMTSAPVARSAPKPTVVQASASTETAEIDFTALEKPARRSASFKGGENALPGVRQSALFEIKRRSGLDDDADVDIYEEDDYGPVQMASAAGMARLAPNGLQVQTESVDVACLKPSLVRVLKQMERHYGKKMVVTSGYRNPQRNRRARGAKNSLHMYCAAADIQIPGVGKWELASYARTMAGRGGVGTYCHTNSVHVDVGPERDWNWRCRGRRR
ncbi:MAG: D-Ala-D-Ala carboxypeptidase family metallohydrolase [Rhizobiaceae bacterium]